MFHNHEQAPVTIPHEAINSLDTLVHAAPFELGPATGHRSFSDEGSLSIGDATGVGNSLQPPAFITPFGAIVKSSIVEAALSEPASSTCSNFTQESGQPRNGSAQLFVDSLNITHEGGRGEPFSQFVTPIVCVAHLPP